MQREKIICGSKLARGFNATIGKKLIISNTHLVKKRGQALKIRPIFQHNKLDNEMPTHKFTTYHNLIGVIVSLTLIGQLL
mgnify:CR=1 FL=1